MTKCSCCPYFFPPTHPLSLERLCHNGGEGEFKMEQAVRFLSFRMRSLKIIDHRRYCKSDSFQGLGVTRPNKKSLPL
jgi:hypothetical protein